MAQTDTHTHTDGHCDSKTELVQWADAVQIKPICPPSLFPGTEGGGREGWGQGVREGGLQQGGGSWGPNILRQHLHPSICHMSHV